MLCLGSATYSAFMSLSGAAVVDFVLLASLAWLLLSVLADGLEPSAGMSLSGALWFWRLLGAAVVLFELGLSVLAWESEFSSAVFSAFADAVFACWSVSLLFATAAVFSVPCFCERGFRRTGERAARAASTMTTAMVFFESLFVICFLLSIGLCHGHEFRAQAREARKRLNDQAVCIDPRQEPWDSFEYGVALREVRQGREDAVQQITGA